MVRLLWTWGEQVGTEVGDARGQAMLEEIPWGPTECRAALPKATFAEIEQVMEERVREARAQLGENLALEGADDQERPNCPHCGQPLVSRARSRFGDRRIGGFLRTMLC
jgi:hypothetical protein